jgi:molybdopterin synthase catalytic subunit
MEVQIEITSRPIERTHSIRMSDMTGALAEFSGIVRAEESGRDIAALEYEAYSPMAESVTRAIVEDIAKRHPCLSVRVIHRIGIIRVGETAIHMIVTARHRAEAFAMLTEFMNRLKQDVPIWKARVLSADEV